ncbi:enoyl-CoA delta isomerase 1, mitochondrial-like [Pectinophora gossypiella]|uniref:enoyl-CoA delta isomerase 1, mitochondrial-like n=1 Tax=Pectinophora gossypiella TaxID=13191 RepID=UPI00214E7304|nr:enoyl-CoA delta isomerase 1, mitochondrial-like [Pectinophora gossypiella]XP_049874317.1 enoyl-CoA delta isomerase 1, mitochondrial-like [Pectinophora gossypiella]
MFPLRRIVGNATRLMCNVRPMSSKGPLVDLTVDNDGVAIMTMQRLPVNSLNLEVLQELSKSLDEVAKNKSKGMILTSASPTVFSAGLDIMEMYKPDFKRAEAFWTTLQEVWLKLYGSNFITAAAINGHAPAGGCLLSMSCEYRAMVSGKFTIGLNETALGIVAPTWFIDTMKNTISTRETEFALTSARLFTVEEALKVGLVDVAASDKADAIEKCKQFIKKFDRIPSFARAVTKQVVREEPIRKLIKNREHDTTIFLTFLKDPKTQAALGFYIENLKKKAAAGK